ncbi:hypothetical protein OAZ88_00310 [bacterium]|nr:hypothetical protein [bacterium]
MANHCSNHLSFEGLTPDQWKELRDACVSGVKEAGGFLTTLIPEPDYSVTPVPRKHPWISAHFAKTEEEKKKILENEPTIREDSWWDWRNMNWGTKWIDYECHQLEFPEEPAADFEIPFESAWSPLNEKCMEVLSKKFPGVLLTITFAEIGEDFCGVTVAKDGVVLDYCTEISKLKESWAKENHPELWEEAENPEDEDATDELYELWWDVEADVRDRHLSPIAEVFTQQVCSTVQTLKVIAEVLG